MMRLPLALALVLIAIWLLLNGAGEPGQWLVAVVLSFVLVRAFARLRPVQPRLRRLHLIAPLIFTVARDVLRSNLAVARITLGLTSGRRIRSGFIDMPLELRDPHGLSMLAAILTSTPGTAWVGMSPDRRTLTVHVLDVKDEADWIRLIKEHYERPLMRIFE